MPNRFDGSIDGVEYRYVRGEGSYQQGASRAMIDFQEIETMEGSQFTSRNDVRSLFQTSWAGGSRWEKPLLSSTTIDSYYVSDNFDMLREAGTLKPAGHASYAQASLTAPHTKWVQTDGETAYAVGEAGATYFKMLEWSDGTISALTEHSNAATSVDIMDICWDKTTNTLYVLSSNGVTYVEPGVGQGAVATMATTWGASIFMHFGELYVWTGEKLRKIEDPLGTPAVTDIFDDGLGNDWAYLTIDNTPTNTWLQPGSMCHAVSTSDGIYIAKNVSQGGTVVAYIYRVDRGADGTEVGVPVATLTPGSIILDIFWSLGSLLMSATSDIGRLTENDAGGGVAPRANFYHLTQDSLGTIGSPNGYRMDEFVFKMMISYNSIVYIGGSRNLWAYDPIRGGIHMLHEGVNDQAGMAYGVYTSAIAANSILYFQHTSKVTANMTNFADVLGLYGATTAEMESNYFDFSLPGEQKYVTEVTVMIDDIQTNETWTVSLEADDGSWASVATFTSGATQKFVLTTPVAAYRFRYKLGYATTTAQTTPSKVKGIMFRALSGEMVPFWQLMIDGTEARNVENEIVRPQDVFDNLKTLRDNRTPVAFIDNYEADDRSSSSSYTVRVHSVTIIKEEPKESTMQVVLVGT